LRAARELTSIAMREQLVRGPVSPTGEHYHVYLRNLLGALSVEKVHATFLDRKHGYLADEIVGAGSGASTEIRNRALVRRALDLGARALILAHNHPSGSSEPSKADVRATSSLQRLLHAIEIELVDHLVIGRGAITSMREQGCL